MPDTTALSRSLVALDEGVNGGEIMYRRGGAKMYHGHRR